jgi:hypothetical protein
MEYLLFARDQSNTQFVHSPVSCLCFPIVCLCVLSSVFWCPLLILQKNDVRFVFTSSYFPLICICLRIVVSNIFCVVFLFCLFSCIENVMLDAPCSWNKLTTNAKWKLNSKYTFSLLSLFRSLHWWTISPRGCIPPNIQYFGTDMVY